MNSPHVGADSTSEDSTSQEDLPETKGSCGKMMKMFRVKAEGSAYEFDSRVGLNGS